MNKHVLPAFGNTPIADITSLDIETFISKLNVRSKTKLNILTPFRLVMKFGKKHGIIRSNPFADVDPIKSSKTDRPESFLLMKSGILSKSWMISGSLFSFCCFSQGYALEKRPG